MSAPTKKSRRRGRFSPNLVWSPFHPSSDGQLLPTRKLEANKDLHKVQGDAKLSEEREGKAGGGS